MRKRVLSAIFACVFAVGLLAGCANSGQNASGETKSGKRIWKFAHTRAEGTDNDKLANEFADKLTSQMDNLQINIYPNNQLGASALTVSQAVATPIGCSRMRRYGRNPVNVRIDVAIC